MVSKKLNHAVYLFLNHFANCQLLSGGGVGKDQMVFRGNGAGESVVAKRV